MKTNKLFTILAILALIFFNGCETTDFDEILSRQEEQESKINDLDTRLKTLEELVKTANSEVKNISSLIETLEKRVGIISYSELPDRNGYEFFMSDGTKITLKNGIDGEKGDKGDKGDKGEKGDKGDKGDKGEQGDKGDKGDKGEQGEQGATPVINVKLHTDGYLYWTLNGEWMLDAQGKMICAQGKDGKEGEKGEDGKTPIMRVNTNGEWEISLDGGSKWQSVKDVDGNPVKAKGEKGDKGDDGKPGADGDSDLSITETSTAVIINYRGVSYTIYKGGTIPSISYITFTTAKESVRLWINALEADKEGIWIDLNNNGFREDEENITNFSFYETYTLAPGVNSIILYGNVTFLACDNNSITELDVKHNPWLYWLECFHNNISGEAMTTLVNSLFDRRMESKYGVFCVIDEEGDGNVCTKAQVNIAKAKKWNVSSLSSEEYQGS